MKKNEYTELEERLIAILYTALVVAFIVGLAAGVVIGFFGRDIINITWKWQRDLSTQTYLRNDL